ncbi:hypothetical protein V5O48_014238 [Marasmius crinis-equi]|uniref:Uncharacterized protein n=1 Tax=Marasmius crinis-equi TaxID=585013 RepID=A0ABR3EXY2_9AGAR
MVAPRTYYRHAPQRTLEAEMTPEEKARITSRVHSKPRRQRRQRRETSPHIIPSTSATPMGSPDTLLHAGFIEEDALADNIAQLQLDDDEQIQQPSEEVQHETDSTQAGEDRDDGREEEEGHSSEGERDQTEEDGEEETQITLDDLKNIVRVIQMAFDYDFHVEKTQWTEEQWHSFWNPGSNIPELLTDKKFRYSLEHYLSLAERSSRETYEKQRAINQKYYGIDSFSHYQVKSRLETLTGIIPILYDMCVNSCMAFTAIYEELLQCIYCGEDRYEDAEHTKPRRRFETIPLGPQIQALWRHTASVALLRHRTERTEKILEQRHSFEGIPVYDDVLCGDEYLDLVESGAIGKDDMFLAISMDGAQIYRDKQSDAWFAIAIVLDFPPELRHSKLALLPLFVIGGPNAPKNYNSFLFPTLAHLSACQKHGGLPIWNAAESAHSRTIPWLAYGTADTVGIAELNGWVGHHGKHGCRLLCGMPGRHKPGIGTYYPAMLRPDGDLPPGASHGDIDINTIETPTVEDYTERLRYVLASKTPNEYEFRRRETGIRLPSLIAGVPKSIHPAKACPTDIMHLFLNVCTLLVSLWRGTISHGRTDTPEDWEFAVFSDPDAWKVHGARVGAAGRHLPVCLEDRVPRNPAEKINSGYKACQRMLESARANALNAMDPTLVTFADKNNPSSLALDVGGGFMLLHPRQLCVFDPEIFDAFKIFSESHGWRITQTSLSTDIFARLLLPNGQIARSLRHEMKRPREKVRPARNVKILLDGQVRYAEVLLFFIVDKNASRYTMAAIRMFSAPDPGLLEDSFNTLSVCTFLGNDDIQIIDAKWIEEVVGMVPFHRNPGKDDTDEFFVVQRLRSLNKDVVNNSEEDEECSLLDDDE